MEALTAALQAQELPRLTWRQRLLRLMPWHKRLALLACLGIFSWAGSGMLHPLMGYLQPRPQTMATPQQILPLDNLCSPAQVLGAAGIAQVQGLRLLVRSGEPYYQARLAGELQPRYWHARSGQAVELAGAHAESLARHYLGSDEPLAYVGSIERFTGEYAFINRLLPVARVDTQRDDSLRLYVDLFHDRLGTLVDQRKAWFSGFFQTMHSFRWLDAAGPLRPALMLVLLASIVSATLFGISLFVARRRARTFNRRLHGWWGLGLALATLSFASSGAWHLLHKQGAQPWPAPFVPSFNVAELDKAPAADWLLAGEELYMLSLLELDGKPIWRAEGQQFASMASLHYLDTQGRELGNDTPRRYAQQRLDHYAKPLGLGEAQTLTLQHSFDHEYGFVFKRLPVFKASYADAYNTALFIDPLDGALASRVQDADRTEGWTFAYLHKWEFLAGIGNGYKHLLLGIVALAHVLLALVGLSLLRRGSR
ncbi:hypothetical protein [Pseudomonas sp. EA_35y_Pfl2_R111]|uniref:hypothetical protein n=1 Tax=Pseudomonas sp. EA_35y_Pfl2_R111 TaxID=3088689 RepID=UPI0030D79E86